MANNPPQAVPSTLLFRSVAIMVLFLTVTICGLQVLRALSAMNQAVAPPMDTAATAAQSGNALPPVMVYFTMPLITLTVGAALSTMLEGISRLIQLRQPDGESNALATFRLMTALDQLQAALPGIIANATALRVDPVPEPPLVEMTSVPAATSASTSASAATVNAAASPAVEAHLERMVKLLEEMREVSMLDENQRQTRRKQLGDRRKSTRLEEAARLINRQQWEEADALLHLLESLHPGDGDVHACRAQFNDARIASQADEWEQVKQKVEAMLALSKYDEALSTTGAFLDRFPTHLDAQQLAVRIRQDANAYTEATSNRMYEEIKTSVENRQWRAALLAIQTFLERFPEHPRSPKIRQQVRVVQKNAEIEERHDLEDRIRDLINGRQYGQAAELSENLLARFPDSPQAAYLTELLPKLKERSSVEQESVRSV